MTENGALNRALGNVQMMSALICNHRLDYLVVQHSHGVVPVTQALAKALGGRVGPNPSQKFVLMTEVVEAVENLEEVLHSRFGHELDCLCRHFQHRLLGKIRKPQQRSSEVTIWSTSPDV